MNQSTLIFIILGLTLGAFVWGRIRYDLVALLALFAGVLAGVVPAAEAFAGFGHPAVITMAAVLVLSKGFQHSGLVDLIAGQTLKAGGNIMVQLLVLTGTVAVLSAFMNNVGALASVQAIQVPFLEEWHGASGETLVRSAIGGARSPPLRPRAVIEQCNP